MLPLASVATNGFDDEYATECYCKTFMLHPQPLLHTVYFHLWGQYSVNRKIKQKRQFSFYLSLRMKSSNPKRLREVV